MVTLVAGVFAEGGLKGYLEYVRSSPDYSSRYIETALEWRDDVPDGIEVSVYKAGSGLEVSKATKEEAGAATRSL